MLNVFNKLLKRVVSREHEGVRHSDDGFSIKKLGACRSIALHFHFKRCFSVVKKLVNDSIFYEESPSGGYAFVIIEVVAKTVFDSGVINNCNEFRPNPPSNHVLVNEGFSSLSSLSPHDSIGFIGMSSRLVHHQANDFASENEAKLSFRGLRGSF